MKTFTDEQIAQVVHEANRTYCRINGDDSHVEWTNAPEWQKASAIDGVAKQRTNPAFTPEQSHESWLAFKLSDGWKFGPVKDAEKKEHPCILPYKDLAPEHKFKDYLFHGIVRTFLNSPV